MEGKTDLSSVTSFSIYDTVTVVEFVKSYRPGK